MKNSKSKKNSNKTINKKVTKYKINKRKCNKTMKCKNPKIKKGGKNTTVQIMTYPSRIYPDKLLTNVSQTDNSTIKNMIDGVEESLIILKDELKEKRFPKKYHIKKMEVKENGTVKENDTVKNN
jgi:hypothetical protein